ncbi:MAG TPA: hypothetical protein VHO06_14240 [Polyangia bacterium]|nr:hypothetical protein [Polyangia bacterium]
MSAAKRTLRRVLRSWLKGEGQPPQLLRRCETCGEKSWRPLDPSIAQVEVDARLANGARADLLLTDAQGGVQLVIQLDGGSRLANRVDARSGLPVVVLRALGLDADAGRWATVREFGLPAWRCRCAGTRALPVDDDFSLRAIGCPIHLRRDGDRHFARVIEDCGRCAFFVGIGYVGSDRRRIQLRCGFGAPPVERRPPLAAPPLGLPPRLQIVAGS